MKVGEAVAALGIVQHDGEMVVVVRRTKQGMAHYRLDEVADAELNEDAYLPTGTFGPGTVTRYGGRTAENLVRINELPFDFDLNAFTGIAKEDLWQMTDAALWPLIEAQRAAVEFTFASIGLTLHRLDYTGYGLAGFLRLPLHKPDAIPAIQALHVRILKRVNAIARLQLCDPGVKDAGTRMMRIPGCLNTKGPIPRQTKTLFQHEGVVSEAQLTTAAGATSSATARIVPATGSLLDEATTTQLIEAISPHWRHGQKHHLALALSGLLAKAGVPEEQCREIIFLLSQTDGDEWDRKITEVSTTYERVRSGQEVAGYFGLKEVLPNELVEWLDGIAERARQATTPKLVAHGAAVSVKPGTENVPVTLSFKEHRFLEPPDSAFHGWIGDYCSLVGPSSEAPIAMNLGVALTVIGAFIGRQVMMEYNSDPLYPNLFTVLVGRSNRTKKDTAIRRAIRVLGETMTTGTTVLNHGITVVRDVGSSTGLLNDLANHQNVLLYMTEFARLMGNAKRKSTETITPTLMEAYDTPPVMHNKSMMNPITAQLPYLSILAAVQPSILSNLMSGDDMNSGFANRICFFCGSMTAPLAISPRLDWAVVRALFVDLWRVRQSYGEGTMLNLAPDAIPIWVDWYNRDWYSEEASEEEESLKQRHHVFIQKIALIYAICDGASSVSGEHINRAIQIVTWMWANLKEISGGWGRSVDGQIETRISSVLAKGPLRRRLLQQQCTSRKWSGVEFGRVYESMVKNQMIVVDPFGEAALNHD